MTDTTEDKLLDQEIKRVLARFSSSQRLDFRWLTKEEVESFRRVLDVLHNSRQMSLLEISRKAGKSFSFVWGMSRRLGIQIRPVGEANRLSAPSRTKRGRFPFQGTPQERAYLAGFSKGDLYARAVSGLAIMVSSTSTHPAFTECFESLFRQYGPVYCYPVFDKVSGYRWKVAARLDNTFSFLLPYATSYPDHRADPISFFGWLAGLVDSDGSIGIIRSGKYARVNLLIANQDRELLLHLRKNLEDAGFHPSGPYVSEVKGHITPDRNIRYNEDMLNLYLQRTEEVRSILRELPLRHREKVLRKQLVLGFQRPAFWAEVGARVLAFRKDIHEQVRRHVQGAEETYKKRERERLTSSLSQS